MDITENSIVLRTGKFRETDVWVKMLTASHGIITVFAFGGSRSRRRFTGCLDSYNYILSRVSSSKNGQFLNLQEASLLGSFSHIRADWKKQGFVANCIRFIEALGVNPLDAEKVFSLTKALFQYIDETDNIHPMIPILFRYRMATEYGYGLELSKCFHCANEFGQKQNSKRFTHINKSLNESLNEYSNEYLNENSNECLNEFRDTHTDQYFNEQNAVRVHTHVKVQAEHRYQQEQTNSNILQYHEPSFECSLKKAYFLVSEGFFVCQACKPQGMMALYASQECLDFLNFIQEFSPEHWGKYTLHPETWREIGRIIDALVRYHLGIEWTEGRFKRS